MSMLTRFRKPGGFSQLLALIETCDPVKQKNLLHLVGSEDPGWAHLVRSKCLTFERVLSWPPEVLLEIVPYIPEKVLICLISSVSGDQLAKLKGAISHSQMRTLTDSKNSMVITPAEHAASAVKLIQIVRALEAEGKIKFQTFDPLLMVDPSLAA